MRVEAGVLRNFAPVAPFVAAAALVGANPNSAPANIDSLAAQGKVEAGCAGYLHTDPAKNNVAGACGSVFLAEEALQGYYKLGNIKPDNFVRKQLHDRSEDALEFSFVGSALKTIKNRVSDWDKSTSYRGNKVENNVDVISVSVQRLAGRAFASTKQEWDVYSPGNQPEHLYHEKRSATLTLCKDTGRWVVASFRRDPKLNCAVVTK